MQHSRGNRSGCHPFQLPVIITTMHSATEITPSRSTIVSKLLTVCSVIGKMFGSRSYPSSTWSASSLTEASAGLVFASLASVWPARPLPSLETSPSNRARSRQNKGFRLKTILSWSECAFASVFRLQFRREECLRVSRAIIIMSRSRVTRYFQVPEDWASNKRINIHETSCRSDLQPKGLNCSARARCRSIGARKQT